MNTLVHTPSRPVAEPGRAALRLLERPAHRAPEAVTPPAEHESLGHWLTRQVERYWAWGEQHAGHHRLGSWLRH
jgi:hypothetical protein